MVFIVRHHDKPQTLPEDLLTDEEDADARQQARELRLASLRRVAGIWAERTDIPADGLEYERTLRNEWR